MSRSASASKYPKLTTSLPPHLHARLQAAATVLKRPVDTLVQEALESHIGSLDEDQLELIDRVAASLLVSSELGDEED